VHGSLDSVRLSDTGPQRSLDRTQFKIDGCSFFLPVCLLFRPPVNVGLDGYEIVMDGITDGIHMRSVRGAQLPWSATKRLFLFFFH
jgi:hypothetical protein